MSATQSAYASATPPYRLGVYADQTRPGDLSSDGASPLPGECSEPFDEAVDEADGETPDDAVVSSTDGAPVPAPIPEPFIEKGDFKFADVEEAEEEARIPGALVGGITPPRPPRVLWYVSSRDMSPLPRCGPP